MPRTGAPPMIGETPTTVWARTASAIPGTARMAPTLTTGLDGGSSTQSAAAIGVDTSAAAVAAHYGAGLIDGWLVDDQDKAVADDPALTGIVVRALPLLMHDLPATTAIARAALDLALELR